MGIFDPEVGIAAALIGADDGALGIEQAVADGLTRLAVFEKYLHLHLGIRVLHGGRDLDAGAAVVFQVKVGLGQADQVHVPVKTAIEGKVRHLGVDPVVGRVVHHNGKQVLLLYVLCHVHPPGGIAAVMMAQMLSVQVHIRGGIGAVDLQEVFFRLGQIGFLEGLGIAGRAAVVVTAAVLAVDAVPGVGQVDKIPQLWHLCRGFHNALGKGPLTVKIHGFSHRSYLLSLL